MKNLKDISKRVAINNNISTKLATTIIENTFEEMSNILINDRDEIRIKNFGTFKFGKVPGKHTKHPTTRQPIKIDDRITIRLGLSTKIKKGLNTGIKHEQETIKS